VNSYVFKDPVLNYSVDFPFLWDEIKISVRYGSNIELARNIFINSGKEYVGDYVFLAQKHWGEMIDKYRIEEASVEPMSFIVAIDNWIEFSLRYVVDYKLRRSTKDKIFIKILQEVDKTKGKVQLASATFELVAAPSLNVKIKK